MPLRNTQQRGGLFGIHGSLSFWLEENSGVPVSIEGTVPIGPLNLVATIRLKRYSGTPKNFSAVK